MDYLNSNKRKVIIWKLIIGLIQINKKLHKSFLYQQMILFVENLPSESNPIFGWIYRVPNRIPQLWLAKLAIKVIGILNFHHDYFWQLCLNKNCNNEKSVIVKKFEPWNAESDLSNNSSMNRFRFVVTYPRPYLKYNVPCVPPIFLVKEYVLSYRRVQNDVTPWPLTCAFIDV